MLQRAFFRVLNLYGLLKTLNCCTGNVEEAWTERIKRLDLAQLLSRMILIISLPIRVASGKRGAK